MFEFLQESLYENNMSYIDRGISTIEDCMYAYECAQTDDDFMVIQESMGSAIQSVFQRIKDAFKKIIEAFRGLFNKEKTNELAKQLKDNPNAANQKVMVADQKKVNKLYVDSVKKVEKGEDPEKVQSWFKKNAKAIAVTTVLSISAGALLITRERQYKEALSLAEQRSRDLDRLYQETMSELNTLKANTAMKLNRASEKSASDNYDYHKTLTKLNDEANKQARKINDLIKDNTKLSNDNKLLRQQLKMKDQDIERERKNTEDIMRVFSDSFTTQNKQTATKKAQGVVNLTKSFEEVSKEIYNDSEKAIRSVINSSK